MKDLKLVKATAAVLLGIVMSNVLVFVIYVLGARGLGSAGYGALSVTLAVIALLSVVSSLGLRDALPRELAYLRARGEKPDDVEVAALVAASISSLVTAFLVYILSPYLDNLLGIRDYPWLLRVAIFSLPLIVVADVLVAIARAYGRLLEKVLVRDIGVNIAWLIGAVISVLLGWGLFGFVVSYVVSMALGLALITLLMMRANLLPVDIKLSTSVLFSLLSFSLPLLVSGILNMVMTYTDTLMLSAIRGVAEAGLYNAAAPLARFVPIVLSAAGYFILPLFSEIYARNDLESLKKLYVIISRWIFVATYPLAASFVATPGLVLSVVFGKNYLPASAALAILALGFLAHVIAGPNGITLIVLRRARPVMLVTALSSALNVALNFLLIPWFGLVGAAIATASSYVFANIMTSYLIYKMIGLNPFRVEYATPVLLGIVMFIPIKVMAAYVLILPAFIILSSLVVAAVTAAMPLEGEQDMLPLLKKVSLSRVLRFFRKA